MELEDNKSQIWYKVTTENDIAVENPEENFRNHLPLGEKKGAWYEKQGKQGSLLVSNPKPFYTSDSKVYVVELSGSPMKELLGEIYQKKFRLVREATAIELSRFGISISQKV
jgi:lipocalin